MTTQTIQNSTIPKALFVALALNFLWINVSEVFRYFAFVMPMMREALSMVPDVAPMSIPVFLIWGVWDTIVILAATFSSWLVFERFGYSMRNAVLAGSALWLAIFAVIWLALLNMNLATTKIILTALPLAWLEMVIAAMIVRWILTNDQQTGLE
jgi:hypothetical protein